MPIPSGEVIASVRSPVWRRVLTEEWREALLVRAMCCGCLIAGEDHRRVRQWDASRQRAAVLAELLWI
jgi:hypothetical protein